MGKYLDSETKRFLFRSYLKGTFLSIALTALFLVTGLFCFVLFKTGHDLIGFVLIALCAAIFVLSWVIFFRRVRRKRTQLVT
jgi:O-antigen/teichoic acid export membrane protein